MGPTSIITIGLLIMAVDANNTNVTYAIPSGQYIFVVETNNGKYFALKMTDGLEGNRIVGDPTDVAIEIEKLKNRDEWGEAGLALAKAFAKSYGPAGTGGPIEVSHPQTNLLGYTKFGNGAHPSGRGFELSLDGKYLRAGDIDYVWHKGWLGEGWIKKH